MLVNFLKLLVKTTTTTMASLPSLVALLLITFHQSLFHGGLAEMIYEDGYTVTTVFDGNKLKINPYSLSSLKGSKSNGVVLLDSSNSLFYTLSLPLSQESAIKRFAGNGLPGFSDGDLSSAMFNKPRSFAVDWKGNVYVADRSNFAVRKISESGVTTIAGGYSKTAGRADGPGRNVTFSADYELTFVPDMCALLVVDHGNKLIRQINLKQEDCGRSEPGVRTTAVWPWIVAVVVSCLVGLLIGFAVRPYAMPHEELNILDLSKSWTSCLMNLGRRTQMHCFGIRSAVAKANLYPAYKFLSRFLVVVYSHLSLMLSFRIKKVSSSSSSTSGSVDKPYVSLLDSDNPGSSACVSSQKYAEQLRDLITFDEGPGPSSICSDILKQDDAKERDDELCGQIHDLIQANMERFDEDARKSTVVGGHFLGVTTLVKRR